MSVKKNIALGCFIGVAAIIVMPRPVSAQLGIALIPAITKIVEASQTAITDKFTGDLTNVGDQLFSGQEGTTQQLSLEMQRANTVNETIADTEQKLETARRNREIMADLIEEHEPTDSACLTPTAGVYLQDAEDAMDEVEDNAKGVSDWWNSRPAGTATDSPAVKAHEQQWDSLEKNDDGDPLYSAGVLVSEDALNDEELRTAGVYIQLLTNPFPDSQSARDGTGTDAIKARAAKARVDVATGVLNRNIRLQARVSALDNWQAATTGKPVEEGGVSWLAAMETEMSRRFGDVGWYEEMHDANSTQLLREYVMMKAVELRVDWERFRLDFSQTQMNAVNLTDAKPGVELREEK